MEQRQEPSSASAREPVDPHSPAAAGGIETAHPRYRVSSPPGNPGIPVDGTQVFIEFPPGLATGEAPPLFVLGERGQAELVNYRQRGRFYVVDTTAASFGTGARPRLGARGDRSVTRIATSPRWRPL
jgi:type IV secretion system protein VirB9